MATLPKTNLRLAYHVACTIGETYTKNGVTYLNTNLGALCTSDNINMWAKYKPVKNDFTNDRPTDWWRAFDNKCGIQYTEFGNVKDMIDFIDTGQNPFQHDPPSGSPIFPYRIGDFAGYNPFSTPPIISSNMEGIYYKDNGSISAYPIVRRETEDELNVSDIFDQAKNGLYYGAAFVKKGSSTYKWISSVDPITENSGITEIPLSSFDSTTYYVYFFLTSVSKPSFSMADMVGRFISCPGKSKQVIEIKDTAVFITITAFWDGSGGVTGSITVKNTSGEISYFSNCSVQIRYGSSNVNDQMIIGERIVKIDQFQVSPNNTYSVDYSANGVLPDYSSRGGGKVYFFANNKLKAQAFMIQSS